MNALTGVLKKSLGFSIHYCLRALFQVLGVCAQIDNNVSTATDFGNTFNLRLLI